MIAEHEDIKAAFNHLLFVCSVSAVYDMEEGRQTDERSTGVFASCTPCVKDVDRRRYRVEDQHQAAVH